MVVLQQTGSPINREERNKINENWERIVEAFQKIQAQVSFLSGDADVESIIERIEYAVEQSELTIEQMNTIMGSLDSKLDELNVAISNSTTMNNQGAQLIIELNNMKSSVDTIMETLDSFEQELIENEQTRADQESQRVISESGRADAEVIREDNEQQRKTNELTRQQTETSREQSEQARVSAEALRVSAENIRIANEQERVAAQEDLQNLLDNMKPFEYDRQATYVYPNLVTNDGNTYMALQEVTGVTPSNDLVNYILIARKGTDGIGSVASVNGVGPDENGNVEIQLGSGDVKTVNSVEPDETGNVSVDVGVKSVNNLQPDTNGNAIVDVGVKTVNSVQPDTNGNAIVDVGVKTVNSKTPNQDGDVTIDLEDYDIVLEELEKLAAIIKREEFISEDSQTVFNLTEGSYVIGQNRVKAYIGGVPQYSPDNFEETSPTSITFAEGVSEGMEVIVEYYEVAPIITDIERKMTVVEGLVARMQTTIDNHISTSSEDAHTIDNIVALRDALNNRSSDLALADVTNLTTTLNVLTWSKPVSNDYLGVEVYVTTSDLSTWDREHCANNASKIADGTVESVVVQVTPFVTYYLKVFVKYNAFGLTKYSQGTSTTMRVEVVDYYKTGNEYVDLTGGWIADTYHISQYGGSGTQSKQSSSLQIKLSQASGDATYMSYITNNKVDLTNLQHLVLDRTLQNVGYGNVRLELVNNKNSAVNNIVSNVASNTSGRSEMTLDVSQLTGNYHIRVLLYAANDTNLTLNVHGIKGNQ